MKSYMFKLSILSIATATLIGMSACSSSSGGGGDDEGSGDTTSTTALNGSAALSGTIATSSSSSASASRISAANVVVSIDEDASAQLIVDENADGSFGGDDTLYTASIYTDGSFAFDKVQVPSTSTVQAQLTVSKDGYAPVVKVIELSNGQTTSIVAEAGSLPVFTEVIAIDKNTTTAGSYLKIGLKQSASGISSYAKIMSLSELNAEADDPSFGEDELSTSVIPLDAIPDSVTEIKADMKAFDPTDPEDSKYFPGEYKGEGKGDSTTPSRLVSVGFDLVSLRDQNGNPVELDPTAMKASKLRPLAIDWDNCLQTKVRYLGTKQVELIESMGDDDNTTPEFEIPMWYYNYKTGTWNYLGEAEYTDAASSANGRAYATMCITENWGQYLNLDYDFAITQPKNICVKAEDQDGNIVKNLTLNMRNDTTYTYAYLDDNGEANLAMTAGDDITEYAITYYGYYTAWTSIEVDTATEVVANTSDEACDFDLNIVVQNPYSTTLVVKPFDINGSVGNDFVYVRNNGYRDYFYEYKKVDANGEAVFKVKPNTNYRVIYRSQSATVNANGAVVAPETADSTRTVNVTLQDENFAPEVTTRFNSRQINDKATSIGFSIRASDANGDAITLDSITLNGTELTEGTHYTVTNRYVGRNYEYIYGVLDLENAEVSAITPKLLSEGTYDLVATFTDGVTSGTGSATLEVLANRAPVINGVYLYSALGYVNLNDVIPVGDYTVYAYAYDPNGDTVTTTYTLDGVATTDATVTLTNGEHTIAVTVSDGSLSSTKSFSVLVGNHPPVVTYAGASKYIIDIASANNTLGLFAYVRDQEDGSQVKSVQAVDQNGTVYPFTFNTSRYMWEASMTPTAVGTYAFDIIATDNNDSNSTPYSVSVQTIANNQPPVFTNELVNETVNVNSEKELSCTATDPEGTWVTYDWVVDGKHINVFASTYTFAFDTTGQVAISCTASDQDGESSTTSAIITVIDPTQTGTLVVNTPMSGLTVAIHNSATLEPISGMEKTTDATGSASFAVTGDRVTFSVSLTSETVMDKDTMMDLAKEFLVTDAMSACATQPDTNTTCSETDWCAAYEADTVQNWMIDLNPPEDENGTVQATADEIDTNNDGVMDADELLAFMLEFNDTNNDGKVSWAEFQDENRGNVLTQMYASVPVREYNLAFSINQDQNFYEPASYARVVSLDSCSMQNELEDFNLTVTGLTPDAYPYLYVQGSGSGYGWTADADGTAKIKVNVYQAGDNGDYSFIVTHYADGNYTYSFLEANATVLSAGVTLDVADFGDPTRVDVLYGADRGEYLWLNETYNGLNFSTGGQKSSETGYLLDVYTIPDAQYLLNTGKSAYLEGLGELNYNTTNYYGDGTLLGQYNIASYPQLDVTLSSTTNGLELAGTDVGVLNLFTSSIFTQPETFDFAFNVVSTQIVTTIGDINISKVLPQTVLGAIDGLSQTTLDQSYSGGSISLSEYKDKTENDLLNMFVESSTISDLYSWYSIPKRSVSVYQYGEGEWGSPVAPQADTESTKVPVTKPFTIGIDVSKAW